MKRTLALGLATLLGGGLAYADTWTGYITDTHCGKSGATKDHTARCVEKCVKGGSKAQLLVDADGKLVDLDSLDKVKDLVGNKVTVTGTIDPKTHAINVEKAEKAQ